MTLETLLEKMWQDYCALNPSAKKIYDLFVQEGESVVNDHIALRTLRHPRLGLEALAEPFKSLGYVEKNEYTFKEKKLYAKHYEHPTEEKPKIFISELILQDFSSDFQSILNRIVEGIPEATLKSPSLCFSGRVWSVSYADYERLAQESEYGSWFSAIGFRPNHFTVFVNSLKKYNTLEKVNQFLIEKGYNLNLSGGAIKGSKEQLLEQSSTKAETIEVQFAEGPFRVPACYYEFARRYNDQAGHLYQGFVAASADKIFESTDRSPLNK